ncbi:hypothetical protein [Nocardia brevicatena]|uniref:hypothetical protein n=1 Tax=Nocardia brevicatena TaxID=37327 RepID=UPI0002EF6EF8|nr:hypothetical protein [Nocardia brevicatena]
MSAQDRDLQALVEGKELADAAEAGELVFGETVDAAAVLPTAAADDPFVVTTVRLTQSQRKRAQKIADERGLDLATLIRGFVNEGLAEAEGDYTVSYADLKRAVAGLRRTA